ncbi:MAG: long-chain-fatty-acid--CoA ligase [Rubrivivax sp.]
MPVPPRSPHWPPGLPHSLTLPATHLFVNAEVAARRFPDKPFLLFFGQPLSFAQFRERAERLAGWLQQHAGVGRGDRVLLNLQTSPQWALAYYAILRADAVVVPVNPMNRTDELAHLVADCGARVAVVAQDLLAQMLPLLDRGADAGVRQLLVATYADALGDASDDAPDTPDAPVPDFVRAPREVPQRAGVTAWADALAAAARPAPIAGGPDDLAVMPYTSGTTGQPKGCMHTHRSVMSTAVGGMQWFGRTQDAVMLSTLPLFHVTGMTGGLNGPLFAGASVVLLPRWDRAAAVAAIRRHRVTSWQAIATMVIDLLALPGLQRADLASVTGIRGGGAAMPAAVAARLKDLTGLDYVEGYGMSETIAATHINPPQRPKPQCLGIPVFDVDARVIDPATLQLLPHGETGEIVVRGPQVMVGYWGQPQATAEAFVELDGQRFLRTGDLGRVDDEGYFFMTDRLKRMVNAAGFKVWPAEVEAAMYHHPAILEACVIGALDPRRGETVKALVVLRDGASADAAQIVAWCHTRMAAYKVPRLVEFVPALPRSGAGKVMWRELQEQQDTADAAATAAAAISEPRS